MEVGRTEAGSRCWRPMAFSRPSLDAWAARTASRPARAVASRPRQAAAAALSLGRPGVRGGRRPDRPGPPARGRRPEGRWSGRRPACRRPGPGRDRVLRGGLGAPGAAGGAGGARQLLGSCAITRAAGAPSTEAQGRPPVTSRSAPMSWTTSTKVRARWAASVSGALSFAVAEPHGWDERSRSSWYGVVPGGPVHPRLFGPQGAQLAHQVGASLGQLAVAELRPTRRVDATGQLARTERGLARAAAAIPALGGRVAESVRLAHPCPRPTGRTPTRPGARGSAPRAVARGRHRTAGSRRLRPFRVG